MVIQTTPRRDKAKLRRSAGRQANDAEDHRRESNICLSAAYATPTIPRERPTPTCLQAFSLLQGGRARFCPCLSARQIIAFSPALAVCRHFRRRHRPPKIARHADADIAADAARHSIFLYAIATPLIFHFRLSRFYLRPPADQRRSRHFTARCRQTR